MRMRRRDGEAAHRQRRVARGQCAGCALSLVVLVAVPGLVSGCVASLLPLNTLTTPMPELTPFETLGGGTVSQEAGVDDAHWLEIPRTREPGVVGGYLSIEAAPRRSLILLLDGASTFEAARERGAALDTHREYAPDFRAAGYRTWSLLLRECPTAYGEGDLADFLEVVDWLDAGGRAALNVDRVYAIGYSTGATVLNLANQQRRLDAMVSLGGLSSGDQLRASRPFYEALAAAFPNNSGMCQLRETLRRYGGNNSPAWEALNSVDRVAEFRSPVLFIHGDEDVVYSIENTRAIEARYLELLDAGAALVDLEFVYLPGGEHFDLREDPANRARILEYFERFEPR